MRRRLLSLLLAPAFVAAIAPSARADDAPLPPAVEAVRKRLLDAFAAAPRVLRAYRIQLADKPDVRVEVFCEADRQGMRITSDGRSGEFVTNGLIFRAQSAEGLIHAEPGCRSVDEAWQPYRLAVERLGAEWGVLVRTDQHYRPSFGLGVREGGEGRPQFDAFMGARTRNPLSWLQEDALRGVEVVDPDAQGRVVLRRKDWEIALHVEDGFPARFKGVHAATGKTWSLTEVPPAFTREAWIALIDEICSEAQGREQEVNLRGTMRSVHLSLALQALRTAAPALSRQPDRLATAVRLLARAAFRTKDVDAWHDKRLQEIQTWISDSYDAPANLDPKRPGARISSLEDLTKYARSQFLEERVQGAQQVIDDAISGLKATTWPLEEAASLGAILKQAAREALIEYLDERWPAK